MIYSKEHAGKWVASRAGKVLAVDTRLAAVLQKIKPNERDKVQLDLVPRSPYLAG